MKNTRTKNIIAFVAIFFVVAFFTVISFTGMPLWTPFELVDLYGELITGNELNDSMCALYKIEYNDDVEDKEAAIAETIEIYEKRLISLGLKDFSVSYQSNDDVIIVSMPGIVHDADIAESFASEGLVEIYAPDEKEVIMTAKDFDSFYAGYDASYNPGIVIEFTEEGAANFKEITKKYVGKTLHLKLDGVTIASPSITNVMDVEHILLSGSLSFTDAATYCAFMDSGLINGEVTMVSSYSQQSTYNGAAIVRAMAIGFAVICLAFIIIYRMPGVMTAISLVVNMLLTVLLLIVSRISMSYAGIIGVATAMIIAAVINVIYLEKVREEVAVSGRPIKTSVDVAFKKTIYPVLGTAGTIFVLSLVSVTFANGGLADFCSAVIVGSVITAIIHFTVNKLMMNILCGMQISNKKMFAAKRVED
ncbi:MAG: hypothetical protein E7315_01840 [Clostridiales bacterium]|nr:hypothetical protein [Clostridiales bacterium]